MKLCTIGYIPPPTFPGAKTFFENVRRFETKHDLITFSDHAWAGAFRLKKSPEILKDAKFTAGVNVGKVNKWALNNVLFLTAMRMARDSGYSHVLYLESDCRVGRKHWDDVVFDEFFSLGRPCIAGGSLACYNPCNAGPEAARRWAELVAVNQRRNFPIPTYGWLPANATAPSCVFPNGALAIYDVSWAQKFYSNLEDTAGSAANMTAFDMSWGVETFKEFGPDAYSVLGHLTTVFSSYGDVLTDEDTRMKMLRDGIVCGCHQVKSDATV